MNIFEMRHEILRRHRGAFFTPKQLKAEFLRTFPGINESSINPADCFNTTSKKAGCTCKECTKLGGFAVNRDGVVDMGTSGFGEISPTYVPTGSTGSKYIFAAGTGPVLPRAADTVGVLRINPRDAANLVREYNRSYYRGRSNTALDREAYLLFKDGPSRDVARLVTQIAFVGKEYGGAQERFGSIREEAELIATNLRPVLDGWTKILEEAKPLSQHVPDQEALDFLFAPFVGNKQWPVWASKTLHFLRPDAFPILDSNAKKPLGLKNLLNSSRGYRQFSSGFRDVLVANPEALAAARDADAGESPTTVKLLDKILFEMGRRMG